MRVLLSPLNRVPQLPRPGGRQGRLVDHGSDTGPLYQPFARESGTLVWLDDDGDELRIHKDERGRWHARRWRANMGRWIGPQVELGAKGLTAKEWRGCAEVIGDMERP